MSLTKQKTPKTVILNSFIGVCIMLFFRYLPLDLPSMTPIGMNILGIFLGTLYLWITTDVLWSSLLSAFLIALSGYEPMNAVLATYMGNPTYVQLFFLMIVIGGLIENQITTYMARFFLSRKITNGRPWAFAFVILVGVLLMSSFLIAFAPIMLMWPVLYEVFKELGYTKDDKYPKILIILVVVIALVGFPIPPFMNNGLALLSNYRNLAGEPNLIHDVGYISLGFIVGFLMLAVIVLVCKFILRPDTEKFKKFNVSMLEKDPLPPMDLGQKITSVAFVLLILCMLLPGLIPSAPGMAFLKSNSTGLAMGICGILAALRYHNKPILNVQAVMSKQMNWSTLFLCGTAILLGVALTHESTGFTAFLSAVLSPLFRNISPVMFTILILVVAGVLTNLCNSLVIGMILEPVIFTYCNTTGTYAPPIVSLMILFVLGCAAITPAASPFAAMLHGNKEWLKSGEIYKYTGLFVAIEFILMVLVGIPLSNALL